MATVISKGQSPSSVRVRAALGVDAGDRIEFVEEEKRQFAIVAASRSVELKGLFRGKRTKPVSIEEKRCTPPSRGAHPDRDDWPA